jgi:hypothetical protein
VNPVIVNDKKQLARRILLHLLALIIGFVLGTFLVFQVLFLYRVLPHGGI